MERLLYKDTTVEPEEILRKDTPKLLNKYDKNNNVKWYINKNVLTVQYNQ